VIFLSVEGDEEELGRKNGVETRAVFLGEDIRRTLLVSSFELVLCDRETKLDKVGNIAEEISADVSSFSFNSTRGTVLLMVCWGR
jgi:hypothetical protein